MSDDNASELIITSAFLRNEGQVLPRQINLDVTRPLDKLIMDEATAFGQWAGIEFEVFYSDSYGTCYVYDPDNLGVDIRIDRLQLGQLFANQSEQTVKAGLYFAIGHECAHIVQKKCLGASWINKQPDKNVEAHADALAGMWLGRRIGTSSQLPMNDVTNAAGALISQNNSEYPSPFQRALLAQKGLSLEAGNLLLMEQLIIKGLFNHSSTSGSEIACRQIKETFYIIKRFLARLPESNAVRKKEAEAVQKIEKLLFRRKENGES